jgi:FixJ family two-component response regulator
MSQGTPMVFAVDDVSMRKSPKLLICNAGLQPETLDSARKFVRRERVLVPSCLVLDIALPDLNSRDLQNHLPASRKDMRIIFVADRGDVAEPACVRVPAINPPWHWANGS